MQTKDYDYEESDMEDIYELGDQPNGNGVKVMNLLEERDRMLQEQEREQKQKQKKKKIASTKSPSKPVNTDEMIPAPAVTAEPEPAPEPTPAPESEPKSEPEPNPTDNTPLLPNSDKEAKEVKTDGITRRKKEKEYRVRNGVLDLSTAPLKYRRFIVSLEREVEPWNRRKAGTLVRLSHRLNSQLNEVAYLLNSSNSKVLHSIIEQFFDDNKDELETLRSDVEKLRVESLQAE